MRALIVGAGAVGQVYGRHLALGGAEVTFFVKEKYAAECRAGFVTYPLNRKKRELAVPERFHAAGVATSIEEVAKTTWDQVYLTVSSTALRAGTWLEELLRATGDATIISLQPGIHDRAYTAERGAQDRMVVGLISLISYHAPLPGETRFPEPGMAYWFPPAPCQFSGPEERTTAVLAAFKAGKMPVARAADVNRATAFPSAALGCLTAALQAGGWSWKTVRQGELVHVAARAGKEAMAVAAHELGGKPPPLGARMLTKPFVLRNLLCVAPKLLPLDVETYFRVHFTKVGDQTRFALANYISDGKAAGLPVAGLEDLERRLAELPAAAAQSQLA